MAERTIKTGIQGPRLPNRFKAEFTVREWCRLGRIHAEKRAAGRGNSTEWQVSHAELLQIRNLAALCGVPTYRHPR